MGELLLAHGASIEERDSKGYTALIMASEWACADTVKMLLGKGADPTVVTKKGRTALWFAKREKFGDIVKLLLPHLPKE